MRISQIAIVALGAVMIAGCSEKAPEAVNDANVEIAENAAVDVDMNAMDMNASADMDMNAADAAPARTIDAYRPTQASPSDSDVPVEDVKPRKGQRPHR